MGTSELFYLLFLFGVWLAVVASINCLSIGGEAGGRRTAEVRTLSRWTLAVGLGPVVGYLAVALPAFQFLPAETSYSVIVGAFAVAVAVQAALYLPSLIRARRLRSY